MSRSTVKEKPRVSLLSCGREAAEARGRLGAARGCPGPPQRRRALALRCRWRPGPGGERGWWGRRARLRGEENPRGLSPPRGRLRLLGREVGAPPDRALGSEEGCCGLARKYQRARKVGEGQCEPPSCPGHSRGASERQVFGSVCPNIPAPGFLTRPRPRWMLTFSRYTSTWLVLSSVRSMTG